MDKLDIKHLAPYLPYGLNIKGQEKITYLGDLEDWERYVYTLNSNLMFTALKSGEKPILRPLSDFDKKITVGDKEITPIDVLSNFTTLHYEDGMLFEADYNGGMHEIEFLYLPYCQIQKLLEWHFDVFGLIEKGLAVDINTIK